MKKIKWIAVLALFIAIIGCTQKKMRQTNECLISQSQEIMMEKLIPVVNIIADTIYEPGIEEPLLKNFRLYYNDSLIYRDTINLYESESLQRISYNDSVLYILINAFDPVTSKTLHVLRCDTAERVIETVVYGSIIKDVDGDSIFEIIGQELVEAACFHCDSSYYSPILVYKLGLYCIYDEKLSEELTIQKYGCYLGKECFDTILSTEDFEYNGIEL